MCWRKKIDLLTNCCLCNNNDSEDFSLSTLFTWEEVRIGILPQPHQILFHEEAEWNSKSSFILTKETP